MRYLGLDRWESTGLSFEDYSGGQKKRMYVGAKKLFNNRRFAAPDWALNPDDCLQVLVRFLELRAYSIQHCRQINRKRLAVRLRRVDAALKQRAELLTSTLDRLCAQYIEFRNAGVSSRELARKEQVIRGIDTSIRVNREAPEIIAAIIYRYFREGHNSFEIAAALGLHADAVRQITRRLIMAADDLGFPRPDPWIIHHKRRLQSHTAAT